MGTIPQIILSSPTMDEWDEAEDTEEAGIDCGRTVQQHQTPNPNVSTAYPDPEDIPSYPWFGGKLAEKGAPTPTSLVPSLDDDSGDEDGIINEDGEQMHAQPDYDDASVDPDFQYSGDSVMYVCVLEVFRWHASNVYQKR